MHFIIGHKSTGLISIVLMSSVRAAVPGAAPSPSEGVSVVFPPAVVLCSKAQQVNSAELTRKKNPTTPEIPGKKAF